MCVCVCFCLVCCLSTVGGGVFGYVRDGKTDKASLKLVGLKPLRPVRPFRPQFKTFQTYSKKTILSLFSRQGPLLGTFFPHSEVSSTPSDSRGASSPLHGAFYTRTPPNGPQRTQSLPTDLQRAPNGLQYLAQRTILRRPLRDWA